MMKKKILFVCTGNRDRSPTAEETYKDHPDLIVKSAGTSAYAYTPIDKQLLDWADAILVMTPHHKETILRNYPAVKTPIYTLYIEDYYRYMDKDLVEVIIERTEPILKEILK
ncbi:MAG: hypothetical protein LBR25_10345 [Erysipelotrichaceae bacterium]|jgi:predicted protein tyrosine phosphatase|nr:hypothetical protein [Erysipelotrichaceae bacterium]